jgi:isopenicillin-N N-acyltransferase-like protein
MAAAQYFPLIEVSGTPRARGVATGRAAADRVKGSVALYRGELARRKVDAATQDKLARRFIPIIEDFDPDYVEEMRGIARARASRWSPVVTVNCRTEMMFGFKDAAEVHEQMKDGCTGVVAMGSVTCARPPHPRAQLGLAPGSGGQRRSCSVCARTKARTSSRW